MIRLEGDFATVVVTDRLSVELAGDVEVEAEAEAKANVMSLELGADADVVGVDADTVIESED